MVVFFFPRYPESGTSCASCRTIFLHCRGNTSCSTPLQDHRVPAASTAGRGDRPSGRIQLLLNMVPHPLPFWPYPGRYQQPEESGILLRKYPEHECGCFHSLGKLLWLLWLLWRCRSCRFWLLVCCGLSLRSSGNSSSDNPWAH